MQNKPEKREGGRLGEIICTSRFYAETKRSKKQIGTGTEESYSPGWNRSHNIPRGSGEEERIRTLHNNLRCLYLNARSIINTFQLFEVWINEIQPDIIRVTESWANDDILDSELSLDGYDLFRKNRLVDRVGGGVLMYIKSSLCPVEFLPNDKFPEQVWCQISDSGKNKFLIGICYHTPSNGIFGDCNNHNLLVYLLNELGSSDHHFVLMGDFNYHFLHWPPDLHCDSSSDVAKLFCDCLDDIFLVQHITTPTRGDAILLMNRTWYLISKISRLGNSDHNAILWSTHISTEILRNSRQVYDYSKANISAIRSELQLID